MIDPRTLPGDDEIFTHVDPDTGETRHFAVSMMLRCLSATWIRPKWIGIDQADAAFVRENRGVDMVWVKNMTRQQRDEPVLFIEWSDGSHLLIDGSHRYVRRALDGCSSILAYAVPVSIWPSFLVDLPPVSEATLRVTPRQKKETSP